MSHLLFPVIFLIAIAAPIYSIAADPAPSSSYSFNRVLPPRMKMEPDILSMASSRLTVPVGSIAEWTTDSGEVGLSAQVQNWRRTISSYTARREQRWIRLNQPSFNAIDTTINIEKTEGYDETQKRTMANALEVEATLTPGAWFSAKAKASLQFTDDVSKSWHAQTVTKVERKYAKDTWLTTWQLVDTIHVQKTTTTSYLLGSMRKVYRTDGPTTVQASIDCVMATYEDLATDAEMSATNPVAYQLLKR